MKTPRFLALAALLCAAAPPPAAAQVQLNGAGATFPNIIYQKWMPTFNQANPTVQLNYHAEDVGS